MQPPLSDRQTAVAHGSGGLTEGRLLRLQEVRDVVGMSKAWIYDAIARGSFPRPVQVGTRAVAWREEDIAMWKGGLKASPHK